MIKSEMIQVALSQGIKPLGFVGGGLVLEETNGEIDVLLYDGDIEHWTEYWYSELPATLGEVPPNNHGCGGFWVDILPVNELFGVVIDGGGCSSCWQVGHDDASSPIEVGSLIALREGETWHSASQFVGYSHNELIDDRDEPDPDTTAVRPSEIVVVRRSRLVKEKQ